MSTEKKTINYNGMELPCITEGYWEDGMTLVRGDSRDNVGTTEANVVCLRNGVAFYDDGTTTHEWKYWAIIPPKPAPRRLTNRELAGMMRNGWDRKRGDQIRTYYGYRDDMESDPVPHGNLLRAPNTDEWLEPTSDLLEVWE